MTLIKWNKPGSVNNDIFSWPYSIFDDFFSGGSMGGSASYMPAVNVSEKAGRFEIEVSAPGFNKEDFKVEAENGVLRISCEHKEETKEEDKQFLRREFSYGSFARSFTLPENVKAEDIVARYENGILAINIPKKQEEEKPAVKEIKIQ